MSVARDRCHARRRSPWHLTPPSSGRPKGRFAPFGPPLMSNVRPHENAAASSLRCMSSAPGCSARLHHHALLGTGRTRARCGVFFVLRHRRCHVSRAHAWPRCSSLAIAGALGLHGGAFTLASQPSSTAAPLKTACASGCGQRPRLSSPRPTPCLTSRRAAKVPHGFHPGHWRVA